MIRTNPNNSTPFSRHGVAVADWQTRFASGIVRRLLEWRRLARSRRELAALGELELQDLGLSRSQAIFESDKAFFRR